MSLRVNVICCVMFSALIAGCAATPTVDSGTVAVETRDARVVIAFSDRDRAKVRHFYRSGKKVKAMPPGLAKRDELPPGLQKHVIKYGKLPPGLAARRIPDDLDRTLSYLPPGYIRVRVGGDVYLMHERTRVVFDVIWNVVSGK